MHHTVTPTRPGPLITWTSGDPAAPPVVLLHDRYRDHDELAELGRSLAGERRVIAVRSARTQMEDTYIKGYYWFIGTPARPELSTFGDGLHHLEQLVLGLANVGRKVTIIGKGEGGTMALMMALVWPDILAGAASLGGPLPTHLEAFPMDLRPLHGLPVLVTDTRSAEAISARGANITLAPEHLDPIAVASEWALRSLS